MQRLEDLSVDKALKVLQKVTRYVEHSGCFDFKGAPNDKTIDYNQYRFSESRFKTVMFWLSLFLMFASLATIIGFGLMAIVHPNLGQNGYLQLTVFSSFGLAIISLFATAITQRYVGSDTLITGITMTLGDLGSKRYIEYFLIQQVKYLKLKQSVKALRKANKDTNDDLNQTALVNAEMKLETKRKQLLATYQQINQFWFDYSDDSIDLSLEDHQYLLDPYLDKQVAKDF